LEVAVRGGVICESDRFAARIVILSVPAKDLAPKFEARSFAGTLRTTY